MWWSLIPIGLSMLSSLSKGSGGGGSAQNAPQMGELYSRYSEDPTEYPGDTRRRKKRGYGQLSPFDDDDKYGGGYI